MNVLIVEDNKKMAGYLRSALAEDGCAVAVAHDGDSGLEMAQRGGYDVVVLDLMLPGLPGLDVLARLRQEKQTPVLIISARTDTDDRVKGLDGGADDYLPKPFAIEEFKARLRALTRRGSSSATTLSCADLSMDLIARKAVRGTQEIPLTVKEFSLLEYLLRNQGHAVPRTSIAENVWGYSFDWQSNIIEVYINQLRNKIDRDASVKLIHTVRGVGYMLKADA